MELKKLLLVAAGISTAVIITKEIVKKTKKTHVGYIPKDLSYKISEMLNYDDIQVTWVKVGGNSKNYGLRLRLFNSEGTELIKTVLDHGIMVAGVTFEERQELISKMKTGDKIILEHNPHEKDTNAVEVYVRRSIC